MNNHATKYVNFMEEIKRRRYVTDQVIQKIRAGQSMSGYQECDIDFLYLQVRKVIELMLFATIVAHKYEKAPLNKKLEKEYNAGRLMRFVGELNPAYFPCPKYDAKPNVLHLRNVRDLSEISPEAFVSKEEVRRFYNKCCGKFSHAHRTYQYGNAAAKTKLIDDAHMFLSRFDKLLEHHWVHLSESQALAVIMRGKEDGKAHAALLGKLP